MELRIRDDWYGNSYEICNVDDLINRLNNAIEPTYEVINDINRYNFDFDYYCKKEDFDLETAEWLKNKLETYIFDALHAFTGIEPNISIATSHTNNYSETEGKYSIRFYITNLMDNKENMKSFVEDLNIIVSEIKDDPITSVIKIDNNKVFDTSIYSSNKKLRCVNTSKPNENRPLLLKKGNIEDTIVTNIKDCVMVNYVSNISKNTCSSMERLNSNTDINFEKPSQSIGILDQNISEIEYYCENGAFKTDVLEHTSWITLGGMFLSIMTPENAFKYWKLATDRDGSDNKKNEIYQQFKYIKMLLEDPIIAINSIRKNIKKIFPTIIENWKQQQRQKQKEENEFLKSQLKKNKEQEKLQKQQEKIEKQLEKQQEKQQKQELKESEKQQKRNKVEQTKSNYTFVSCDDQAINIIINEIQTKFIYCNNQMFYKDGNKWIHNDKTIDKLLMKYILESQLYRANEDYDLLPYCQNVKTACNIRTGLLSKLSIIRLDDKLYDKFHSSTKNKLCFIDGVLDLKHRCFTEWTKIPENTIFTTVIIDREFKAYFINPNKTFIDKIKTDIMDNLFGEKVNLALQFFSRAIGGNIEDKNFMSYSGNRNCGKGILYSLFSYAFGNYITSFNLENMICRRESNKSSDLAKENAWLLPLEFSRIAIAQETDENENDNIKEKLKISNKAMKSVMSGGDVLKARALYQDPREFTIDATLAFFGNNELAINGDDSSQHHLKLNGVKQFITQEAYDENSKLGDAFISAYAIRDETLKEKIKTDDYSNAMVYLLYESFIDKSITIKNDIDDDNKEHSVRKLIFMTYELTNNDDDRISKDILYATLKADKKKILAELKQLDCVGDCNCKTTIETYNESGEIIKKRVQAFRGLKLKVESINEDAI